ncbi:MAG: hypothetical protein WC603_02970 [Candidatus Paceibacterota bacterium]|jgi:hypothetical protein
MKKVILKSVYVGLLVLGFGLGISHFVFADENYRVPAHLENNSQIFCDNPPWNGTDGYWVSWGASIGAQVAEFPFEYPLGGNGTATICTGNANVPYGGADGNFSDHTGTAYETFYTDSARTQIFGFIEFSCVDNVGCSIVESIAETCLDGIQNQDETAIDFGGVCRFSSRLYHISPVSDSTTSSSVFDIVYKYYVNSVDDSDLDKVLVTVCPRSYSFDDCQIFEHDITTYDSLVEVTDEFTAVTGQNGLYEVAVSLWNGDYDVSCSWYQVFCTPTTSRMGPGDLWTFNVINQSGEYGTPEVILDTDFYVNDSCGSTDLGCQIKNAIKWFYVVSPTTLQSFSNLSLQDSVPFSYIYDVGNLYDELFENGGSAEIDIHVTTPIGQITFINADMIEGVPYASTIKTILGALLYLFTAMTVYKLVLNTFHSKV